MRYCSLNNTSLSYFYANSGISELSGSSTYKVQNGVIEKKGKQTEKTIENTTALHDYIQYIYSSQNASALTDYVINSVTSEIEKLKLIQNPTIAQIERVDKMIEIASQSKKFGPEFVIRLELLKLELIQKTNRYQKKPSASSTDYRLNKSKVKSKLFALFNLDISKKYIAFVTVTFPYGTSDDIAFKCWNSFLTACRKRYQLQNYLWVLERQKNGTIHYHMLTNNRLPVQQANRALAIIINNQVKEGLMCWGNSSLEKYNGLDIDSIYGSKRHKKTGKFLSPADLRNWILQYVTKYVTKNMEKFSHLAWHCSHSVSKLFTSSICEYNDRLYIVNQLPMMPHLYEKFVSDFNVTFMFKFVPIDSLFDKIKLYNNMVMAEYEPINLKYTNDLTHKSTSLWNLQNGLLK